MSRRLNPLSEQEIAVYNRELKEELDELELALIGEEIDIAQEELMDIDINDASLNVIAGEFDAMAEEIKLLDEEIDLEEEEITFQPSERIRRSRRRRKEQRERKQRQRERKQRQRERKQQRGRIINIDVSLADTIPQLYEGIKDLRGRRIRIITMDMDFTMQLSENKTNIMDTLYATFMVKSQENAFNVWNEKTGEEIIPVEIIILPNIEAKRREQKFAEGEVHCLFGTILDWAKERFTKSNSKDHKKRWQTKIRRIEDYIKKYKKGVPEKDIQEVCNKLQINIEIVLPLLDNNLIECRSNKKALKSFRYINSKLDHCDEYFFNDDNVEYIDTAEEMKEIFNSIKGHKVWTRNQYDYTSILTDRKKYILRSDFRNTCIDFEYDTGLNNVKICDIKDMKLSMFVRQGVHYNSMINMNNDITFDLDKDIWHIDMEKAYANYEKCFMYEGFCGKITDFRKTNKLVGIGLYRITNINFDNCHDIVKRFFVDKEVLDVYVNMNVYPSPELKFLRKMGVSFDIVEGCWGNRMFFSIPKEMKKKNDKGSAYYALYFGCCNSGRLVRKLWLKGSYDFFRNLKSYNGVSNIYYDDANKEGYMECLKERNYHSSHITAFITAYQRISVFEQMLEYEPEDIVRIHTDAIYATKEAEIKNVFRHQIKKLEKLSGSPKYLSNIEKGLLSLAEADNRKEYDDMMEDELDVEYHKGPGGTGKTHNNLTDEGFIKILYVGHSWKLATEKRNKYNCNVSVHARLLSDDPHRIGYYNKFYNVIFIDEISMLTENDIKKIIKNYNMCKIIFAGDVGYQLPAFNIKENDKVLTEEFMEWWCPIVKEYKKNYRIQDDNLLVLCNKVRQMIKNKTHHITIIQEIKKALMDNHFINIEDVKTLYNLEDMILCSVHKRKDIYTETFKGKFEKEKYYINNNNSSEYHRGDIIISDTKLKNSEVRHGFTIHAIQGEDAKHKLFIDLSNVYSRELIYTALSRARKMEQIYLIRNSMKNKTI